MTETLDIWQLLEVDAPEGCDAVQELFGWSLNYMPGEGPFNLFLDLIGWSEDNYGESAIRASAFRYGYLECAKLGDALTAYADAPHAVREYVDTLMNAEA